MSRACQANNKPHFLYACSEPFHSMTIRPGSNRVQITCNTSSVYDVQHVVLRATWYEGIAQLLSLTECKSHLF